MVERDFAPRARIAVQLKDMRNALDTAASLGFTAPITGLLEQLYAGGALPGLQEMDQAALYLELAQRNGMK
jgi:2-hydroxy-3-oxopropionate reductase